MIGPDGRRRSHPLPHSSLLPVEEASEQPSIVDEGKGAEPNSSPAHTAADPGQQKTSPKLSLIIPAMPISSQQASGAGPGNTGAGLSQREAELGEELGHGRFIAPATDTPDVYYSPDSSTTPLWQPRKS